MHDALNGRAIADLAASIRAAAGLDDEAFVDTLDGCTDAVEAARRVVRTIREDEASEAALKALESDYGARRKRLAERRERARDALATFLSEIGEKTLKLPEATLSLSAGRVALAGDCEDANALPADLTITTRKPDRAAIKAALEAGREVPGFALSNGRPTLTVRVR